MFSMDELLSKRNQKAALAHLQTKSDSIGADGMRVSEFDEYWRMNHEQVEAVLLAQQYIQQGNRTLVEVDLKNFFDTVKIEQLLAILHPMMKDAMVYELIKKYLYCKISYEGQIQDKQIGLVQGNSISPILSNLFLHSLDEYLQGKSLYWLRFADNTYIFTKTQEEGIELFNNVCSYIRENLGLEINAMRTTGIGIRVRCGR